MPLCTRQLPINRVSYTASGGGGGSTYQFPLPAGKAMRAANMTAEFVFPRPDAETSSYERPRLHPSLIPLRIPVGVRGGRPPFRYSVSSDLSGLTIGQDMPTDWQTNGLQNYGVLMCDTPAVGTYTTTVTCTDQDSTAITVTFTTAVVSRDDTTKFRWYDFDSGSNAAAGTWTAPYKDDSRLAWGTTSSTTTFQGQIWYKPSTTAYPLTAHTDISPSIRLNNATRPVVACAMPASAAVAPAVKLSFSAARFGAVGGAAAGLGFFDINCDSGVSSLSNMQNFVIPDSMNRITFFNSDVTNITVGSAGDDNATFCFFTDGATTSEATFNKYVFFRGVTEDGRPNSSNSYGLTSAYGITNYLFEDCHGVNSSSADDFYLKDSCKLGTVRYCSTDKSMGLGGQSQNGGATTDNEFVHCASLNVANDLAFLIGGSGTAAVNTYISRCSFFGWVQSYGSGIIYSDDNVIETTLGTPLLSPGTVTAVGTELQGSSDYIDANGKLNGAYSAYRGTRGWEIFDV